jgi:hypothetical protein
MSGRGRRNKPPNRNSQTTPTPPRQRKKNAAGTNTPVSTSVTPVMNKTADVSIDIITSEADDKGGLPIKKQLSRENVICKYTVRSSKNRRSVSESDKHSLVHNTYCVCKVYKGGALSIQCDKCLDYWHLECVSLKGLTKTMIDSIEVWFCPNCFESPYASKPDTKIIDSYVKQFKKQASRIDKCNEELGESVSHVEYFNQHIRHLLIDDVKFKDRSPNST